MTNIPLYRAKKIDSDEYVEGYLIGHYIFKEWIDDVWTCFRETKSNKAEVFNIDPSTLSISFEDMKDSEGTRIFASLSKDGKGGDILKDYEKKYNAKYDRKRMTIEIYSFYCEIGFFISKVKQLNNLKVIGIQE